jgi:hypothetical protein
VVGEDLRAPRGEGLAERANLGYLIGGAAEDRLAQQCRFLGRVLGEVDVSN